MNDSLASLPLPVIDDIIVADTGSSVSLKPLTPYQVLRMLPKDATPAQQDSAIQAWFQPGEIHYSTQPDTLHLPGHEPGRSLKDISLPQYYRESYFSNDTLFHPELSGGRQGVAGDPVPYTIRGDNMFTSLLLLCFMLFVVSVSHARRFFVQQLKHFFYTSYNDTDVNETSGEVYIQLFLVALASFLLAIVSYQYTAAFVADTFVLHDNYQLVGLFFLVFAAYFLCKGCLYWVVNSVFFDARRVVVWQKLFLFITATEGALLFPAVLVQVYFDFPLENAVYYFLLVFIFTKILTIYKCWSIFFSRNGIFLQIILYFCALEIVPLLGLMGGLKVLTDQLTIII